VLTRKSAYVDEPINDDLRLQEYNVEQVIRYIRNLELILSFFISTAEEA
jgi:hypothetical protein